MKKSIISIVLLTFIGSFAQLDAGKCCAQKTKEKWKVKVEGKNKKDKLKKAAQILEELASDASQDPDSNRWFSLVFNTNLDEVLSCVRMIKNDLDGHRQDFEQLKLVGEIHFMLEQLLGCCEVGDEDNDQDDEKYQFVCNRLNHVVALLECMKDGFDSQMLEMRLANLEEQMACLKDMVEAILESVQSLEHCMVVS